MSARNALLFAFVAAAAIPADAQNSKVFTNDAFAAKPLEFAEDYFKSVSIKNFKGTKRVAIAMTEVTFIVEASVSAKASDLTGGMRTGTAVSSLTMALGGVSQAALQAITNQYHDDVAAAFKEMGVEVVDVATMKASPAWASIQEGHNAEKLGRAYVNKNFNGSRAMLLHLTSYDTPLIGTGMTGLAGSVRKFKALGDALGEGTTIVVAQAVVNFVALTGSGGLLANVASVSGKPAISLLATQLSAWRGVAGGASAGKVPLYSTAEYSTEVKEAGRDRFANPFGGEPAATHMVMGDETKFKAGVSDLLKGTAQMFTTVLKDASR
jgi:hypothetical protein